MRKFICIHKIPHKSRGSDKKHSNFPCLMVYLQLVLAKNDLSVCKALDAFVKEKFISDHVCEPTFAFMKSKLANWSGHRLSRSERTDCVHEGFVQ